VDYLLADLSSLNDIRRLAKEFKNRYPRLDVLVNNAGGLFLKREVSVDGIELTFALNHLAYFLLTNLLLDVLKANAPSRVVSVSSAAHIGARLDFADLQVSGWDGYKRSKLANLLFTYELARRLEGTRVTANALHPGLVASDFGANNRGLFRLMKPVINLFAISNERGAQTSVYLASSPEVEGVTGQYCVRRKPVRSSETSYDRVAAARLWEVSAAMTGLAPKQSCPAHPRIPRLHRAFVDSIIAPFDWRDKKTTSAI
jgi:NAD(P)-dependent dehydrogenase (short-subunit alcohol dehydrogenase family)